jgi:hypothetical protein
MSKSKERRTHPRVWASLALQVTRQDDVLVSSAENLSRSGIMCTLPEQIQLMTRVRISLCLPPVGSGPNEGECKVSTEGVIVRSDQAKKGAFETAIFFPELSEEEALSIDRFVKTRPGSSKV